MSPSMLVSDLYGSTVAILGHGNDDESCNYVEPDHG